MRAAGLLRKLPWLTVLLLSSGAALAALPECARHLALSPEAVANGEWWRLWTAHLVHYSLRHMAVDFAVLLICGGYLERQMSRAAYAAFWLLAPPLLSVSLLLTAGFDEYRGASGLAAALLVASGATLWRAEPALRRALTLLAVAFALKTAAEAAGYAPNPSGLAPDIRIVWQAHFYGAALGLGWVLLPGVAARALRSWRVLHAVK